MNIRDLAWIIVDGEQWEDIDKILGYEIPDDTGKEEILKAVEDKLENMSDKQLQKWVNKYR